MQPHRAALAVALAALLPGCLVQFPGFDGEGDAAAPCFGCADVAPPDPCGAGTCQEADGAVRPFPDGGQPQADAAPGRDDDGDGVPTPEDCDDGDPRVRPGAVDVCGDGVDGDCGGDGETGCLDLDRDGDGVRAPLPDEDVAGLDCDDANPAVYPAAAERCNGADDDCDERADEGLHLGEACTVGDGACAAAGRFYCDEAGDIRCDAAPGPPGPEVPGNGVDDDCDRLIDEARCDEPGAVTWPGNGHCYGLAPFTRTWWGARDTCDVLDAHLVTIGSAEENTFVHQTFRALVGSNVWMGLDDEEDEDEWRWLTGEPLAVTFWGATEPNDDGDEDCAEMREDGLWNDARCYHSLPFVCERD